MDRIVSLRDARDLKLFIDLISARGPDRAAMITAFETHKRQLREVARLGRSRRLFRASDPRLRDVPANQFWPRTA
ncbi:hypothetical protein [Sphingomonas sp. TZW2008]|uniref:hypothetical protein n=1 Tax=Sphingomonas sp. TZW2008 TaxID=1917973 RepID=UPI001181992F|nr:hypothetical protein [Sphingomonas sp. TZW2008]